MKKTIKQLEIELDKANDLINVLYESGCLDTEALQRVQEYIQATNVNSLINVGGK